MAKNKPEIATREQQGLGLSPFMKVHRRRYRDVSLHVGNHSRPTPICRILLFICIYSLLGFLYVLGPCSYPDFLSVFPPGVFLDSFSPAAVLATMFVIVN